MILNFNQEKATLCIKKKTIKSPEQRTDLLAFSRTNTLDSHTVFKKTKWQENDIWGVLLLKKDGIASLNRQLKKLLNFTFILKWNDLIYSAAGSEEREDQFRFLGNCPPKSYMYQFQFLAIYELFRHKYISLSLCCNPSV